MQQVKKKMSTQLAELGEVKIKEDVPKASL